MVSALQLKTYFASGNLKKNLGNKNMSMIAPFLIDSLIENCSSFSLFPLSIISLFDIYSISPLE